MAENDIVLPRFFSLFLSGMASESMVIPMSFMEHLVDPLPQKAKLLGTGGGIWTVGFTKVREHAYFTDGWSKFAEDHDLTDGEYLTFVYDGYRTFEVSVYGRCGSKETRAVAETVEIPDSDEEEDASMGANDDTVFAEDEEISHVEETGTVYSVVAGSSNVEDVDNICFETTLKKRTYELLIPTNVVKDYGLMFGPSIKYIDEEGTIEGKKANWGDDRVSFKGWNRICRRNKFKKDDTIHCEILRTGKHVHSVKVYMARD